MEAGTCAQKSQNEHKVDFGGSFVQKSSKKRHFLQKWTILAKMRAFWPKCSHFGQVPKPNVENWKPTLFETLFNVLALFLLCDVRAAQKTEIKISSFAC